MSAGFVVASLALGAWVYLLGFRGMFWLARDRDEHASPAPQLWPSIVAVVPARDEAELIWQSIGSLLAQDYPGEFRRLNECQTSSVWNRSGLNARLPQVLRFRVAFGRRGIKLRR